MSSLVPQYLLLWLSGHDKVSKVVKVMRYLLNKVALSPGSFLYHQTFSGLLPSLSFSLFLYNGLQSIVKHSLLLSSLIFPLVSASDGILGCWTLWDSFLQWIANSFSQFSCAVNCQFRVHNWLKSDILSDHHITCLLPNNNRAYCAWPFLCLNMGCVCRTDYALSLYFI